jgi:hypothetical protein
MLIRRFPGRQFVGCRFRLAYFPVFLICCFLALSTKTLAGQDKPATDNPPAPSCFVLSDDAIPVRSTIQAKVIGTLDAGHQKAGRKLWLNSVYDMDFPGCHMVAGAPIYGVVTAASSTKSPDAAELSLAFDAADCVGHDKHPMKLIVVGLFAPPDQNVRGHDAMPTEVAGGARQISSTMAATNGYDADLNPAGPFKVPPGSVYGFKNLKLEPLAGPQCSARFTSPSHKLELPTGAVLLLALQSGTP